MPLKYLAVTGVEERFNIPQDAVIWKTYAIQQSALYLVCMIKDTTTFLFSLFHSALINKFIINIFIDLIIIMFIISFIFYRTT